MRRAILLALLLTAGCGRRQHQLVRAVYAPSGPDATETLGDDAMVHNSALGSDATRTALFYGLWLPTGIGLLLAAIWSRTHRRRSRLEAEALRDAPMANGPAVVVGRVETDGGDAITVAVTQRVRHVKLKSGQTQTYWDEKRREVTTRPFRVVTDHGRGVLVQPDARVHLRDQVEAPDSFEGDTRRRCVRLRAGERVWVSGVLSGVSSQSDAGAYREAVREPVLKRGLTQMVVSTEPPGAHHASRAGEHAGWLKGFLITLALVHFTVLADVTLQLISGHNVTLNINHVSSWDVWVKPKNQRGHWVRHCAVLGRPSGGEANEEREVSCGFFNCAAEGRCLTLPTRRALLTGDLLRDAGRGATAHIAQVSIASIIGWSVLIAYLVSVRSSRPWYAGGKVNDGP